MADPIELIRQLYPQVPFQKWLGIEVLETLPGRARVRLPFKDELGGAAGAYHGGVIGALIDLTGALAAWSGHDDTKGMRGSTVTLTTQYLSAAIAEDVVAEARVLRRGKELIFCDIDVVTAASGKSIAHGAMVYRIAV